MHDQHHAHYNCFLVQQLQAQLLTVLGSTEIIGTTTMPTSVQLNNGGQAHMQVRGLASQLGLASWQA